MPDDIHRITLQLRAPRGRDPGKVAIGHYVVVDGYVTLTDEAGKPTGGSKQFLDPGGDARLIACRPLRKRQKAQSSGSDFNGPIKYPKMGY
jgi:hypothetical protein